MSELKNLFLLAGDALAYFAALALLFRWRHRLGIGTFFCTLGVMHFIETYLASTFYVALPFGIVTSPGSTVLFAGKLMLLLLVYIREDAVVVRQPIYGLLIGNLLMVTLAIIMRHHDLVSFAPGRVADFGFLNEMGALMVWGTVLLFLDCILIVLVFERMRALLGDRLILRLGIAGAAVLTFDQIGFWTGLHLLTGAPLSVLVGGWIAKMAAVAFYAPLVALYLVAFEGPVARFMRPKKVADIFDTLTYRERYEDLLARSGRDALTGVLDRGRLETQGRRVLEEAAFAEVPASLLLIDIDNFKDLNDRFGHTAGDAVLKRITTEITRFVRSTDFVYRYGGEEFVVICDGMNATGARSLAERIRAQIAASGDPTLPAVTVSIGIATCGEDGTDYDTLFAVADRRLYRAKAAGRNCVVGENERGGNMSVELASIG
jgi:diguanylate cyclase (GGDEF)-like protein